MAPSSSPNESIGDASLYFMLWMILPNTLTGFLQSTFYKFKYSPGSAPQPGSAKYKKHHKIFYVLVVGSYLLFCILQAVLMLPQNYYSEFSLPTSAPVKEIRAKFRKFTLQYHPDKNPSPEAETTFIHLKKIYEVITHPITKKAYEKFGSSKVDSCSHCILFKDYIYSSTMETIANYIASGVILFLLVIFNTGAFSQYFRVVTYFSMMVLEANMLFLPYDPIYWFFPHLTVSEKLIVLHQWCIYFFMAINNFGPLFAESDENDEKSISKALASLSSSSSVIEKDLKKGLKAEMFSFATDPEKLSLLRKQMEKISAGEWDAQREKMAAPAAVLKKNLPKRD
ncbi:hypothetical protein MDAP_001182 [Mitosporidium daphniae]|uniref:Haperone protein DnaJ-related protein n=1 Tax=Mitosporidium daphniae TaxID=1485682 RepID=A0A098VUH5_9MICR|nr:haperone protein DnaJ-related protein [Mitosporidium daphniae]KGG52484.1 haperone protein DnaJ-related protein [Mitosporidium daphniae]|eukprot:XP_013238911.1 haperone protein DnaJ-related protein [Mitosporidium daphniae]